MAVLTELINVDIDESEYDYDHLRINAANVIIDIQQEYKIKFVYDDTYSCILDGMVVMKLNNGVLPILRGNVKPSMTAFKKKIDEIEVDVNLSWLVMAMLVRKNIFLASPATISRYIVNHFLPRTTGSSLRSCFFKTISIFEKTEATWQNNFNYPGKRILAIQGGRWISYIVV